MKRNGLRHCFIIGFYLLKPFSHSNFAFSTRKSTKTMFGAICSNRTLSFYTHTMYRLRKTMFYLHLGFVELKPSHEDV